MHIFAFPTRTWLPVKNVQNQSLTSSPETPLLITSKHIAKILKAPISTVLVSHNISKRSCEKPYEPKNHVSPVQLVEVMYEHDPVYDVSYEKELATGVLGATLSADFVSGPYVFDPSDSTNQNNQ